MWLRAIMVFFAEPQRFFMAGISFERGHATLSAGIGYQFSDFEPSGFRDVPEYATYRTVAVVVDGEFIMPVTTWFGMGLGIGAGLSRHGANGDLKVSFVFGDLD